MTTIHLVLITLLVERDDVDATNALQMLENAEKNVLNELMPKGTLLSPLYRQTLLNSPSLASEVDTLITYASQNGARDIFRA